MMRLISADFFARSPVLAYPVIALGLFMLVFITVSLRAWLTQKTELDAAARIPFDDNHQEGRHG